MPFICSRQTIIQTFQYRIIHRTIACNEWLKNIKIKLQDTCSFCHTKDTITHFFIHCKCLLFFWKSWAKSWENITNFNIREEDHIHKSILFGFPGTSDGVTAINYCLLYAKNYIYLQKFNDKNKKPGFNVDFLGYLCYLKGILKIKQNICFKRNSM